jgi:hypothetical protein
MRGLVPLQCDLGHLAGIVRVMTVLAVLLCCGVDDAGRAAVSLGVDTSGVLAFGGVDRTEVVFVRVKGGGHAWPTGPFDASYASGQFFATHAR